MTSPSARLKLDPGRKDRATSLTKFYDWILGKWFDSFAPPHGSGPRNGGRKIPDPMALRLTTTVSGVKKQDASTGLMIFDVFELIEWASRWMTLEPGDVIATGTPSGVGSAAGTFLSPGDVVEVEIERIGKIRNEIRAAN